MRPISQAVPGAVAAMLRAAPLSQGKVRFAWDAVVGTTLQRVTDVHLEGHLLIVDAATTQWARELYRSERLIVRRLGSLLGPGVVRELQVRARTPGAPPTRPDEAKDC
jgi:hypothetical protein